jgi:hypothetical protein
MHATRSSDLADYEGARCRDATAGWTALVLAGQPIALYDLDRTVTVAPTFTPFLVHMAARNGGWRLAMLPLWLLAMLGYKFGLYGRDGLKRFGLRLMVGREVRNPRLQPSIDAFVDQGVLVGRFAKLSARWQQVDWGR